MTRITVSLVAQSLKDDEPLLSFQEPDRPFPPGRRFKGFFVVLECLLNCIDPASLSGGIDNLFQDAECYYFLVVCH